MGRSQPWQIKHKKNRLGLSVFTHHRAGGDAIADLGPFPYLDFESFARVSKARSMYNYMSTMV
jgi:hypothetical protein